MKDWFEVQISTPGRVNAIESWPAISMNLDRLIELECFDQIKAFVDANPAGRDSAESLRFAFYLHPAVVKQMRSDDENADTIDRLLQEAENQQLQSRITSLFSSPLAIQWLLETRGWERFNTHLQRLRPADRTNLFRLLGANPAMIGFLVENGHLDGLLKIDEMQRLLAEDDSRYLQLIGLVVKANRIPKTICEMIEQEDDQRRREQIYFRLRPQIGTTLFNHDQRDWLIDTLEKLSADVLADRKSRYFSARRGELRRISLEAGRFDVAERMMLSDLSDDSNKMAVARFLLQRGKLDQFLEQLASHGEPKTAAEENDRDRLKFYLLRAAGRFEEAQAVAMRLGNPLAWSLAIERHDWASARDLPVPKAKEMPFPLTRNDINPIHRKIEQLGFQIVLNQLTGRDQLATGKLIELIESNVGDPNNIGQLNTARYGADALLTIGQPREAFDLLRDHYPRRVFYWYWDRFEFDQALASIEWSAEKADQCFDRYSFGKNGSHAQRTYGLNYMLQIAIMLRQVQRNEDLAALLAALQNHPERNKIGQKQRSEYLMTLATRLYQEGFSESSRAAVAKISDQDTPPDEYFSKVYGDRSDRLGAGEAAIWWSEFAVRYADDTPLERLARVDAVMTATTPIEELRPLPTTHGSKLVRVPITCFRYGLYDEARRIFDEHGTLNVWDHAVASGRMFLLEENYQAAAESFFRAWELRTRDLTRLYVSGYCCEKAGHNEKGRQYKQMARLLPTSAGNLHRLAIGLGEEGLFGDATELDRVVMRTAAPGGATYVSALSSVQQQTDDAEAALRQWRELCLHHLRPILYRGSVHSWLRSITRLHVLETLAAINDGDYEQAEAAWQNATQISMGYTWVAHQIVPALRERGQHELADRIFRTHEAYLVSKTKDYPQSDVLKERLKTLREICTAEAVSAD